MTLSEIIFNDLTDYDEVLEITKKYYSENTLNYFKKSDSKITIDYLYNILICIYSADFFKKNKASDIRYQKAVKKAFFALNPNK